jgi:integrase
MSLAVIEASIDAIPAQPPVAYSRAPKRGEALVRVAQAAAALCDALHAVDTPGGAEWRRVALTNGGLAAALDDLARSTGKTPGLGAARRAPGPRTELDARGYARPESNQPGAGAGRVPKNKGRKYPPDPPTVAETIALIRGCPDTPAGRRLAALIPFLWRTGLRISEALDVHESDLNFQSRSVTVRRGKGGKRRVVGMDEWGWQQLEPWLVERQQYPPGPVFCVVTGPTAGRTWQSSQVRRQLRKLAADLGIRRRVAPHQFRHALAVDIVREGNRLDLLQKQLGHANLGVTTTYLASVTNEEVVGMAAGRHAPTLAVPDLLEVFRG